MKVRLDEMSQSQSFADLLPIRRMNAETGGLSRSPTIDLTATPDFALGAARVRPSTCEVLIPRGAIRLQHKVMQVLVALADSAGAVVPRDILRARCWSGQVVGDDSINRCIQRLRQLSEVEAPGSFTLETLPRLGYRFTAAKGEAAAPETLVPRHREPWLVLAGGAAGVAAIGVAAATGMKATPAKDRVKN